MGLAAFPALGTEADKCVISGKFSARIRVYNEGEGSMAERLAFEVTSPPRYDDYFPAELAAKAFADEYNRTGEVPDMSENA